MSRNVACAGACWVVLFAVYCWLDSAAAHPGAGRPIPNAGPDIDTWVPAEAAPKPGPPAQPVGAIPNDGDIEFDVEWGGQWWPARALEKDGERTFIHYVGWGPEWDEWVTRKRVREHQPGPPRFVPVPVPVAQVIVPVAPAANRPPVTAVVTSVARPVTAAVTARAR